MTKFNPAVFFHSVIVSEYVQLNVALVCLSTFGVFQFLVFVHKHFEREGGVGPLLGSAEGGCHKWVRWRIKREG